MDYIMPVVFVVSWLWVLVMAVFIVPLRMAACETTLPAAARVLLVWVPVSFVLSLALLFAGASDLRIDVPWLLSPALACGACGGLALLYGLGTRRWPIARAGGLCCATGLGGYAFLYFVVAFIGGTC